MRSGANAEGASGASVLRMEEKDPLSKLFEAIDRRNVADVEKSAQDLVVSDSTTADDSLNRPSWCHGGRCALFEAISTDDSDLLGALLRGCGERLDVNLRNGQGLTPLHFAVRQRNAPMVKLLLGHPGCDPDIKDNLLAQVPLHEMVGSLHRPPRPGDQPHVSLVKPFSLVVRKDPGPPRAVDCGDGFESAGDDDADDADDGGGNASNVPYLELFSSLAERCDFNIPCRANKESILHRLAAKDSASSFALLRWVLTPSMMERCNLNLQNAEGETPLMVALERGDGDVSGLLIQSGTDLFVRNKFGETALHIAARKNRVNSMKLMLRRRVCPVGARDLGGNIPLHLASARGFETVVMLLADAGAREALVRSRNRDGDTPLDLALGGGFIDLAEELLRRAGVPPTKKRTVAKVSPKLLPAAAELIQSSPSFPRKSEGFDGVTVYHRSKRRPAAAAAADDEVYDQD